MATPSAPPTFSTLQAALSEPFPFDAVAVKPGALTKDRRRGLALAFVDPRAYMERLDAVVGPEHWSVSYQVAPLGVVCRLTILGHVREDVGDFPPEDDPNRMTSAAMQAFKRCCAAFGLGRYLYHLPPVWADYDDARTSFTDPAGVVAQVYRLAGLPIDATPSSASTPRSASSADPQRLAPARAALAAAEQRTNGARAAPSAPAPGPSDASEAQLGLIARLIGAMQRVSDPEEAEAAAEAIDALGEHHGFSQLSTFASRERLRTLGLKKSNASTLIQQLQELQEYAATAA
jgi:hypothetical protein